MLSVTTQVKNGISAVRRRSVLRAVHLDAKQERPEISRKGLKQAEKPESECCKSRKPSTAYLRVNTKYYYVLDLKPHNPVAAALN